METFASHWGALSFVTKQELQREMEAHLWHWKCLLLSGSLDTDSTTKSYYTTLVQKVDLIINEADLALCLTSKYPYIRERKKYLLGK